MQYINQLEYPHLKYNHNLKNGGPPEGRDSVKTSGCGLCCASMVVEHLTVNTLPIEECVKLSEENGANLHAGTTMEDLGPVIAERYALDFSYTKNIDDAIANLRCGGRVIALVGGDRDDGYVGLFAKRLHYILLVSYDGDEFCILDPAYTDTKFTEDGRVGRTRIDPPFIYASKEEVMLATQAISKRYFLFSRKRPKHPVE